MSDTFSDCDFYERIWDYDFNESNFEFSEESDIEYGRMDSNMLQSTAAISECGTASNTNHGQHTSAPNTQPPAAANSECGTASNADQGQQTTAPNTPPPTSADSDSGTVEILTLINANPSPYICFSRQLLVPTIISKASIPLTLVPSETAENLVSFNGLTYEIDRIIDHRISKETKQRECLVGFAFSRSCIWAPLEDLRRLAPQLAIEYLSNTLLLEKGAPIFGEECRKVKTKIPLHDKYFRKEINLAKIDASRKDYEIKSLIDLRKEQGKEIEFKLRVFGRANPQ